MFYIYSGSNLIYEPGDQIYSVLDPKLTLEMGKAGSLEFIVPADHPYITQFQQLTTPILVKLDTKTIFEGRVLTVTRTFSNQRNIYCEGVLSYLVDSVQKAEKFNGKAHTLFEKIINAHNARMPNEKKFYVGNISSAFADRDVLLTGQEEVNTGNIDYKQIAINSIVDEWNNSYDYIDQCLISYCGGYLMPRKAGSVTYLDWVEDYTNTASQTIEFGSNMLDLTEETSVEDLFTVLIPLGDDNLTIASVNGGSDELVDSEAVSKYGRIVRTHVFSNVNQPSTLLEDGRRYLAENVNATNTLTIKAVDLHLIHPEINAVYLGDRVFIRSKMHNIGKYLTCTKIEYDLANPENTVYTFGREKQTLTQRYREDKRKESDTYNGGIGSSASSMGSNWGNIASDVLNKSKEETTKQLDEFYDAWVDWDETQGTVTLGAMYKKLLNDEEVLKNNVGIDMDAPSGTINIYADHRSVEETKNSFGTVKTVLENNLGIDFNAPQGTINIYSDHNKITETATDIGKVTRVLKQNAGLDIDSPEGTVSIYATADLASNANGKASDAQTKTARILAWAGEDEYGNIGTRLALDADLVEVTNRLRAVEGMFQTLTVDKWARFSRLIYSPQVYAGAFFVDDGTEESGGLNLAKHYHTIQIDANGKLYLSEPTGAQNHTDLGISTTAVFGA